MANEIKLEDILYNNRGILSANQKNILYALYEKAIE